MKTCKRSFALILAILLMLAACGAFMVCAADGDANKPTVRATNVEAALTLEYKQTKTFDFEAENLPDGASVHVFQNGEDKGETLSYTVEKATEDYIIEAKAIDKDGSVIATSGEIKVTVKNGIGDRLRDFFKNSLHTLGDGVMDFFGAIFMRIWVFLHR